MSELEKIQEVLMNANKSLQAWHGSLPRLETKPVIVEAKRVLYEVTFPNFAAQAWDRRKICLWYTSPDHNYLDLKSLTVDLFRKQGRRKPVEDFEFTLRYHTQLQWGQHGHNIEGLDMESPPGTFFRGSNLSKPETAEFKFEYDALGRLQHCTSILSLQNGFSQDPLVWVYQDIALVEQPEGCQYGRARIYYPKGAIRSAIGQIRKSPR